MWRESRTQHLWRGDDGRRLSRRDSREGRGLYLGRLVYFSLSPPPQSHTHSSPPTPNSFGTGGSKRREGDYFPTQNRRKRPRKKAFTIVHTEKLKVRGIFATPPSLPPSPGEKFSSCGLLGLGPPPPPPVCLRKEMGVGCKHDQPGVDKKEWRRKCGWERDTERNWLF